VNPLLKLALIVGLLAAAVARAAEPKSVDQVRAELERQLQELVQSPAPEVQLLFQGLKQEDYKLVEVHFWLDGEPLEVPSVEALGAPGPHVLMTRQVAEGSHSLVSNVVYMDASWSLLSETSGFLWNMTSTVSFQVQRGLRAKVTATPLFVPDAKDPRQRIKLTHGLDAEMIAKLADEPLATAPPPEPPKVAQNTPPPEPPKVVQTTPPPEPPKVVQNTPPAEPPKTVQNTPPPPDTSVRAQKALLLVRATVKRKPVDATVYVRGATAQQVVLKRGAKAPSQVEVVPGTYSVDVIAKGHLAQTRQVQVTEGSSLPLDFELVRAPKKKLVQRNGNEIELKQPLRFPEGRGALLPGSSAIFLELVDAIVQARAGRIRIEGHTHSQEGESEERQKMTEARARAVADMLVQAGVDPARVEAVGFGDTRPKAPNLTPRGRELNRRVDIILLEQ
jgi:outer membrane protein OmpA-like peptidoglycan-associated protein